LGLALVIGSLVHLAAARHEVEPAASTVTVHVGKAGLFRTFGDDHEVGAPLKGGSVDDGPTAAVAIVIDAPRLKVLDPNLSQGDRDQVQARMLGPDALDVARFPQIRFQSTRVDRTSSGWKVTGELTLHGETHPIMVTVTNDHSRYRGSASFKQTEFGMKPVTVAGGAVRVKDEISIDFDITTR
jgi:hypothetical protein